MTETVRTRAHDLALAIRHFLAGDEEAARLQSYQAARDAMAAGGSLLELAADHEEALGILLAEAGTAQQCLRCAKAAAELLAESLGPYEMAHRGFQEANETLLRLNRDLERQVSERLEAEEAAARARDEAERANRAKSEFLSRMSHELRTPLNSILGFGQLLEMDNLEPGQEESVQHILKGGRHLLDLINEVLDIARIESGRMTLSVEPLLLMDALSEAVHLINPLAAEQGIALTTQDSLRPDLYVRADRRRLQQVLLNLLSNAVKYNRPGGSVTVRCTESSQGGPRIEVTDQGAGIAPEMLNRLFVPFERLEADTTDVEGTGLGLALSKGLIEAMGGQLGLESRVGTGSTFFVDLVPADAPESGLPESDDTPRLPLRADETHTLLHVEDNVANLKLIERALSQRTDLRLLSAMQGRLGLDLARQHQPDLILLDVHLPDLLGEEFLRYLQADPRIRNIPVIVLSADATPGQIQRLLSAGARAYLTKPLDIRSFLQLLDTTLREHSLDHSSDGPSRSPSAEGE